MGMKRKRSVKRSRHVRGAALAMALVLALAACGGGDDDDDAEPTDDAEVTDDTDDGDDAAADDADDGADDDGDDDGDSGELTTVTVWDRAGGEASARERYFEQWNEEEGPELGIFVDYQPQATNEYGQILRTAFQTDRGPDVFHSTTGDLGAFAEAGWIQPIGDLVDPAVLEQNEQFIPDVSALVIDGEVYAIPSVGLTIRLFYNQSLFEEAGLDPETPPTTHSELYDMASAITEAGNGEYYGIAAPVAWVGFPGWVLNSIVESGYEGTSSNQHFDYETQQFESERAASGVQLYRDLIADGIAVPGAESMTLDMAAAAISAEEAAMVVMGSMLVPEVEAVGGAPEGLAVADLPVPDGREFVQNPMNAGFPFSMSSNVEDVEAATTVLEVITSADIQAAVAEDGVPPLVSEAWESPAVAEQPLLLEMRPTEVDQQWPRGPESFLAPEGLNFPDTITRLVLDTSTDIEAELADLAQRFNDAYERAVEQGDIDPANYGG